MEDNKLRSESNQALSDLIDYCHSNGYKGWDPYDGLNSLFFQATPLKHSRIARLAWIQLFKRNPFNLRPFLAVKKDYNTKGLGLFLHGYCDLYRSSDALKKTLGLDDPEILKRIHFIGNKILELRSKGYDNFCWGYNFDWQNRVFFQPAYTPTVVATSFVANALFEGYEITKDRRLLDAALSAANFVKYDLNRYENRDELIFSYSPLDDSKVYNASLLGARLLARASSYSGSIDDTKLSQKAVRTICDKQEADGSWIYGEAAVQGWVDSFHTGFNLECIFEYMKYTGDMDFKDSFNSGIDFYLKSFFKADGIPKYYHNKTYPIDIHSPAQLTVTLIKTGRLKQNIQLCEKVLRWTFANMKSKKGYYFYQMKKGVTSKIPYMRWAQAWMFYALCAFLKETMKDYENLD
ncbi:delta-aminolevulinic acid dehydratase [Algoriphagus sediminis]|uniref:Delta-aminolevulinic acid dehydratase n=1 Tax=Algoriphagus sediminis TaxID=3057113 RepID=A0ABT7YDS2_9BACT|nr:delta-aminolevulinic acid dehydratase [Algoriphagus sediminis]MDN3204668.1 delta-aminolevulinic acid dehydratase [Algoriphagus sediminis]